MDNSLSLPRRPLTAILPWLYISTTACSAPTPITPTPRPVVEAGVIDAATSARGTIQGRVVSSNGKKPLRDATVIAFGNCTSDSNSTKHTYTDDDGRFTLDLQYGECGLNISYGLAQHLQEDLVVAAGNAVLSDAVLDDAAARARKQDLSNVCPASGHPPPESVGAPASDVEGIAQSVLFRFARFPNYLSSWNPAMTTIAVDMEVHGPIVRLPSSVFPANTKYTVRAANSEEIRALRRARNTMTEIVSLSDVSSNGTCATIGIATRNSLDIDLYERREGSWRFVRRIGGLLFN